MKNIQVIDGALNTTYSVFAVSNSVFKKLFPEKGQDIEFADEAFARLGKKTAVTVFASIWKRQLQKSSAVGIHGTLFFDLAYKKKYYPTKREADGENLVYRNGRFVLRSKS